MIEAIVTYASYTNFKKKYKTVVVTTLTTIVATIIRVRALIHWAKKHTVSYSLLFNDSSRPS